MSFGNGRPADLGAASARGFSQPRRAYLSIVCLLVATIASGQTPDTHDGQTMPGMHRDATQPASGGWHWIGDASAFVGFNYQAREFRDFHASESQFG